jgi:hypothetical protein
MGRVRAFLLCLCCLFSGCAFASTASATHDAFAADTTLGKIASWLDRDGREGWLSGDVADAVGIPRLATEELLEARQLGVRSDEALRIVQRSADERRDFLLFMVQNADGRVFFYVAGLHEGLKGAYVSVNGVVTALDQLEAEVSFRRELVFWEGRVAVR